MTIMLIAILIGLAVILVAPADPGRRLRELVSRAGRDGGGPGSTAADEGTNTARNNKRKDTREADMLWAIGAVENCAHLLKAGLTPRAVMATMSRSNPGLRPISRAIDLGEDPGVAIAGHPEGLPPTAAEVFAGMAAVWTVSERSGAPAADMILRYASAQRDALDADRERAIAMAGPRATVRVLSWLPLIGVALGLLIGVKPVELISGVPGQLSLGSGAVLYLLGRLWMRAMMTRAAR